MLKKGCAVFVARRSLIRRCNEIELGSWSERLALGLVLYYVTTSIVFIGIEFGVEFIPRRGPAIQRELGFVQALTNVDGVWYAQIVRDGYSYDPTDRSNVVFFPLYPLIAATISQVTGLSPEYSLLLVSHACLGALFVMTGAYVLERYPNDSRDVAVWSLLALGLWPTTLFMRMAYTESLFMLLVVIVLWSMHRHRPALWIAFIIGLMTACRSPGVAMLPVFGLYLWQQRESNRRCMLRAMYLLPMACWGLIGYMVFQYYQFGDPLAFVKTQSHWVLQHPTSLQSHVLKLVALEPLWANYHPESATYWARSGRHTSLLFSFEFANPIYFAFMAVIIGIGRWRKWINGRELLLSAGLLIIPYVTHSYQVAMASHARYAGAVVPAYFVIGQLLNRTSSAVRTVVLVMCAVFLALYSALFAASYGIY